MYTYLCYSSFQNASIYGLWKSFSPISLVLVLNQSPIFADFNFRGFLFPPNNREYRGLPVVQTDAMSRQALSSDCTQAAIAVARTAVAACT